MCILLSFLASSSCCMRCLVALGGVLFQATAWKMCWGALRTFRSRPVGFISTVFSSFDFLAHVPLSDTKPTFVHSTLFTKKKTSCKHGARKTSATCPKRTARRRTQDHLAPGRSCGSLFMHRMNWCFRHMNDKLVLQIRSFFASPVLHHAGAARKMMSSDTTLVARQANKKPIWE